MTALTASQTTSLVSQTSATAPATTFAAIWNYLPAPPSLDASIIASTSLVQGTNTHPVVHYALDCPAADSPANNFCRDLGQYPEEVRYTYGATSSHVWGTRTDVFGHGTTAWDCALGPAICAATATAQPSGPVCQGPVSASCMVTVTNESRPTPTITQFADFVNCDAGAHSAVLHITAGLEKLKGSDAANWLPSGTWKDVGEYAVAMTSKWNSELGEYGCPTRTVYTADPEETTDASTSLSGITAGTHSSTGTSGTTTTTMTGGPVPTAGAAEARGLGSLKVAAFLGAGAVLMQMLL